MIFPVIFSFSFMPHSSSSLFLLNKQYFFRLPLTIQLIAKSSIANAIFNHSLLEFIILKYNAAVWRRQWHPTPVLFCLENPMDGGAWQAAVHGVAKNRTGLSDFTLTHWRRKWQPTSVFLPGESQGQGSLVGCCLWDRTESDTTEVT